MRVLLQKWDDCIGLSATASIGQCRDSRLETSPRFGRLAQREASSNFTLSVNQSYPKGTDTRVQTALPLKASATRPFLPGVETEIARKGLLFLCLQRRAI